MFRGLIIVLAVSTYLAVAFFTAGYKSTEFSTACYETDIRIVQEMCKKQVNRYSFLVGLIWPVYIPGVYVYNLGSEVAKGN